MGPLNCKVKQVVSGNSISNISFKLFIRVNKLEGSVVLK